MAYEHRVPVRWSDEEDQILRAEVSRIGVKDWNRIAIGLPGRSNKDCRKRWSKIGGHVNKGAWSPAEDYRLRKAVATFGIRWTTVASMMRTRHADQCAKRWYHYLDPAIDHSKWDEVEDARLIESVGQHGRKWSMIRELSFPGRSPTDIKNRYVTLEKRERQTLEMSSKALSPEKDTNTQPSGNDPQFWDPMSFDLSDKQVGMTENVVALDDYFVWPPQTSEVDRYFDRDMLWYTGTPSIAPSSVDTFGSNSPWYSDMVSVGTSNSCPDEPWDPPTQPFDQYLPDTDSMLEFQQQMAVGEMNTAHTSIALENLDSEMFNKVLSMLLESSNPVKVRLLDNATVDNCQ